MSENPWLKYSLVGENAARAVELGLAEAEWYTTPVPRETMRRLLERRDGPAVRDTLVWFGLLGGFGTAMFFTWGTWWFVPAFLAYAVIYGSTSDSRWHEAGHGTAFRTDWMNNALYWIASFMVMREPTVWRWSHTRHHSDTIIVGRDPEIPAPRPPDLVGFFLGFFPYRNYRWYFPGLWAHARGRLSPKDRAFIPESEAPKVQRTAIVFLAIYGATILAALLTRSLLPLFYIGLPNLFGNWLAVIYGATQHAGLAENVLDHRLNCRTVRMNPIHRFLYWNMNYHVEHHMFPLVPYHALPRLHEAVKHDMPEPYPGLAAAWKEILATLFRQTKEPSYYVRRKLPAPATPRARSGVFVSGGEAPEDGWIEVCDAAALRREDVIRFDHGRKTYAIARTSDGKLHATDGICTHGHTHLADGLVKDGILECPKHNGRFHLLDGSPARAPICRGLATYPVEERAGRLAVNVRRPGGAGARREKAYTLRVAGNRNVSTFIKELVLEPANGDGPPPFVPGDYMQLDIPAYDRIRFSEFDVPEPFASVWRNWKLFDLEASNPGGPKRNNYSLACRPGAGPRLRFNVRIAMPPPGQDCPPGAGSSYIWHLKEGDTLTALGPFGDFHIKPTRKEMVFLGGGAGMAPLRAQLEHLFEAEHTKRRVSFWYASRTLQEMYYQDYFEALAREHPNFTFHPALSSPLEEDRWTGLTGRIHEVAEQHYLRSHPNLRALEFYICGPPMMVKAVTAMLDGLGVERGQMAWDEF